MPCQVCSGSILLKTSVERIFKFSKPSWRVLAAETRGTASVRSDSANEPTIGFEDDPNGKCGAPFISSREFCGRSDFEFFNRNGQKPTLQSDRRTSALHLKPDITGTGGRSPFIVCRVREGRGFVLRAGRYHPKPRETKRIGGQVSRYLA